MGLFKLFKEIRGDWKFIDTLSPYEKAIARAMSREGSTPEHVRHVIETWRKCVPMHHRKLIEQGSMRNNFSGMFYYEIKAYESGELPLVVEPGGIPRDGWMWKGGSTVNGKVEGVFERRGECVKWVEGTPRPWER